MGYSKKKKAKLTESDLKDLVIESDAGARNPSSKIAAGILAGGAFLWSLFQLWIASPIQFDIGIGALILNDTETRAIHLAFAIFLSFIAYPAFKSSPRHHIPAIDIIFSLAGAFCAAYIYIFYEEMATRSGIPTDLDIVIACAGMVLLLEATRRALGPPLLVISVVFLLYTFFGNMEFVPDLIRWKGASLNKIANHQWLTTEGVFGIALGVSTSFVFLFVLFGALLDRAGAGNYFIKVAFSLLGHMRGGPAKAAVLSSAMTGLISGSSIANTVTTGTFTIPLMKRVGFSGRKAGAVEVASSVNGQIMPPVMGAAAFLMVEYVGIPYIEVIKHAFLPAIISYIALLYMVHLEALKSGMQALKKPIKRTPAQGLIVFGITVTSIIILAGVIYYSVAWMKDIFGKDASIVLGVVLIIAYVWLLHYACQVPELEKDDPNAEVVSLPETSPTVKAGLHYLLPIVVLVWCLMVERLSPGLSAYWATLLMIFILATQKFIKAIIKKTGHLKEELKNGLKDLYDGMIMGARNMIGIGVATAAAGIIVGTVSLTGIGQVLTEVIEAVAGGSLILILLLTALICLILGMGLPTTANYIVVASLMAHVVQELGMQEGLFVPMIAIHLFVFYFGIMADVTPPVGLASFAAAAISGADPIRTGIQAFTYSLRTAILPFFFIFNTELIMVGVDSVWYALWVFFYATVGILIFSAAIQGYFIVKNKLYETATLFLVSVTLFVPSMWVKIFYPSFVNADSSKTIEEVMESQEDGVKIKIFARGENKYGNIIEAYSFIPITEKSPKETLLEYGITPFSKTKDGKTIYDVGFDTLAFRTGIEFDFVITKIKEPHGGQPDRRLMYIPAVMLLILVVMSQSVRRRKEKALQQLA